MNVFDSYIDAGQELSKRDREAYYTALLEFLAYGKEPSAKGAALAVFTAIRPSLELSRQRSESGRRGGTASDDGKQTPSKREANAEANAKQTQSKASSKTESNGQAKSKGNSKGKEHLEKEREKEKARAERLAAIADVVNHLNAACGTSYRTDSETSAKLIGARIDDGFTADDCKRVVDNMAAAWLGDAKMRQFLRPTTLFRKEKFEGYLNQGALTAKDGGRYAEYD